MSVILHTGDNRDVMAAMEPESVDSIVTDPPYGLAFMGKDWDHGVPGIPFWEAALRVAKPGAHLLAFGGTRTFHRLAVAIEDAGWEIRDTVMWVYGQGFPKSHDVSKAIDREAGAEREVVGTNGNGRPNRVGKHSNALAQAQTVGGIVTSPATPDAARWQGWGTALKPAWEPIIVARKPFGGTVAANVLEWGTGAINVDGCRVGTDDDLSRPFGSGGRHIQQLNAIPRGTITSGNPLGRWPANLIHDGSEEVVGMFPQVKAGVAIKRNLDGRTYNAHQNWGLKAAPRDDVGYGDTGSAARFFYVAKASKADRDEGCEGLEERDASIGDRRPSGSMSQRIHADTGRPDTISRNHHPTVKPTDLMRYLCRLVTPPGGVVLDPFMGSGSTGKGAVLEGFSFVGIDQDAEYVEIARRRIAAVALPLLEVAE